MANKKLFTEFKPTTTEAWEENINKDLKGADYEKRLITRTTEGINIKPYYRIEDLSELEYLSTNPSEFPFVRTNNTINNFHEIRQDIIVDDFISANNKAKEIISKGVTSLGFNLNEIDNIEYNNFSSLLQGIDIEKFEVNFLTGKLAENILTFLIKYISKNNLNFDKIRGAADYDPLGYKTITGNCYEESVGTCKFSNKLKSLYELVENKLPNFKILSVNAQHFRNAGSTAVQEVAFGLAAGSDYLAKATDAGIKASDIAPKMKFTFGAASNYFMEIAKIRASRLLWAKIVEAYGVEDKSKCDMYIHSVTCDWNKTAYDPYVNVLRTTTESMSAILGGTDSLTVNPFDSAFEKPDDFSERIARNTQIILKEEAYFDKAVDPSAGSYYIESLTNSIAEHAWKLFLEIENKGGYHEAFDKGIIKEKIEETARQRDMNIAQRKEILLGTNQYPDRTEKIKLSDKSNITANEKALKLYRAAEAFEELRQKTEKAEKTPKVFMFTIGNLSMRKARAAFSTNFFACAGFEIIDNSGFKTIEEGVNACLKAEADITVICSSDDEYSDIVPVIFEKLKEKSIVAVAGYPKNSIDTFRNFGIEHFIHVKSNVLESLSIFQTKLGM